MFYPWTFAALMLALVVPASLPANAQQADAAQRINLVPLRHLAPEAMNSDDIATLHARQNDLDAAARVYGYNLEEGNWDYEQTLCAPMPQTILLHYLLKYPDKTESLFTALVPRGDGPIRIVPVLYRNATPYLPAAKNPRNYALFNSLVPQAIAGRDRSSSGSLLELSACYAELTGDRTDFPLGSSTGIAVAPSAMILLDARDNTASVTFAGREGENTYKVWSIAFNKNGRVTAAGTEDHSVYAATAIPRGQPAAVAKSPGVNQPGQVQGQTAEVARPAQPAPATGQSGKIPTETSEQTATIAQLPGMSAAPAAGISASGGEPVSEPGWKVMLNPAEPASKIIPSAPAPMAAATTEGSSCTLSSRCFAAGACSRKSLINPDRFPAA